MLREPVEYPLLNNTLNLFVATRLALLLQTNGPQLKVKGLYLKESLEPPHLENAFANQEYKLEDTPPLDTRICAFGCVSVDPFSDNDIGLLVADLGQRFGKATD